MRRVMTLRNPLTKGTVYDIRFEGTRTHLQARCEDLLLDGPWLYVKGCRIGSIGIWDTYDYRSFGFCGDGLFPPDVVIPRQTVVQGIPKTVCLRNDRVQLIAPAETIVAVPSADVHDVTPVVEAVGSIMYDLRSLLLHEEMKAEQVPGLWRRAAARRRAVRIRDGYERLMSKGYEHLAQYAASKLSIT
jgi:hypothetical protein